LFRRATGICAVLATLAGVAALPARAGATAPCPVEYCTDSTGKYELVVPPLTNLPIVGNAYADCVWNVHVDFGDGTSEDLVFDASTGLTGSHVFPPTRGVTYSVEVHLTQGRHTGSGESCTDFEKTALVRYRTAAEEEGGTPPPWEVIKQEGIVPAPLALAPVTLIPNPYTQPSFPAGSKPVSFWRRCRAGVRTHGVDCRKGRRVIGRASDRLARRRDASVAGFDCLLTAISIVCRRGTDRILGPPA
jgi:hypothetical protein